MCIMLGCVLCGASAAATGIARTDPNSRAAHAELIKKALAGHIDVYFLGDSITRRWGTADPQYRELYANWQANFYGWNAADFGWGGDTTWNILWRLKHGELDQVKPKVIVLLAGTNDLSGDPQHPLSPDETVRRASAGVAAIVGLCRAKAPQATLILTGITPRSDRPQLRPLIARTNARIARLADGLKVRYLDLSAGFSDTNGTPAPGMLNPDGLHLAVRGYQVWADALRPLLESLLGPRAATDAAPPPSRNPGLGSRAQ